MKLFAGGRGGGRLEGGERRNITDKMYNQSTADRKFLRMPKKKGDFCVEL